MKLAKSFDQVAESASYQAMIAFTELSRRNLITRSHELPARAIPQIIYTMECFFKPAELAFYNRKLVTLPRISYEHPLQQLNIKSLWDSYLATPKVHQKNKEKWLAASIREFIVLLIKQRPELLATSTPDHSASIGISIYASRVNTQKWKKKGNRFEVALSSTVKIIDRLRRKRQIKALIAIRLVTGLKSWVDLTLENRIALGQSLQKLSTREKIIPSIEEQTVIGKVGLWLETGELEKMEAAMKKNYTLEETFLDEIIPAVPSKTKAQNNSAVLQKLQAKWGRQS